MITQERLKELLNYNPKTGVFTRKFSGSGVKRSLEAGSINARGYVIVMVEGFRFKGHRLAFLYMIGYLSENQVDHIDRCSSNNSWSNLREVSQSCNMRNTGNSTNNTSGVKGVIYNKLRGKWVAQIDINRKTKYIGTADDFLEAVCLRLAAEQSLDWAGCDSSSPAYKYVMENIK